MAKKLIKHGRDDSGQPDEFEMAVDLLPDGRYAEVFSISGGGIGNFIPGSYDADLTMNGAAQAVALATGTMAIKVTNRGVTTEAIRVAFGSSQTDAENNLTILSGAATTGDYLPAAADQGDGINVYGVPANATHYAIANAVNGDVQVVSITQGI